MVYKSLDGLAMPTPKLGSELVVTNALEGSSVKTHIESGSNYSVALNSIDVSEGHPENIFVMQTEEVDQHQKITVLISIIITISVVFVIFSVPVVLFLLFIVGETLWQQCKLSMVSPMNTDHEVRGMFCSKSSIFL